MTTYSFGPGSYREDQLAKEIAAAGLTLIGVFGSGFPSPGAFATAVSVGFDIPPSAAQQTALAAVVAAHVPKLSLEDKLDRAIVAQQRLLLALAVLSATSATAAQKARAQAVVDAAYNQIVTLLS